MARHPQNFVAACYLLLNSIIGAVRLPNATYISESFDQSSLASLRHMLLTAASITRLLWNGSASNDKRGTGDEKGDAIQFTAAIFPKTAVEGLGLIYESYKVTTADGYTLNLNRIVNPDQINATYHGVPVLFVNGMAMHSDAWLLQTKPELNLPIAYLLAGYDVWLGDQRGTVRSREHVRLSVVDWRFWDFSFHETGVFDLPAFIDFILFKTGQLKLVYSGISLGGAFYYVMCTERPEYQDKLYGGILWQPVGEMPDISSMPFPVALNVLSGERLLELEWSLGGGEAPPFVEVWRKAFYGPCSLAHLAAEQVATLTLGWGCHFQEDICLQMTAALGGTSAKTVLHTIQLFRNGGVFNMYDYGAFGNYLRYGQNDPLIYNISSLRVFTALYTSDIDVYAPTRVVVPFSRKFTGLTYTCEMKGVCHGFANLDPRGGPFVQDSVEVLNSMTGRGSNAKVNAGQCQVPNPVP